MLYKPFKELNLSRLGMGNMRLPKVEGQGEKIDETAARAIVEYAYTQGINYYDTAFPYHGGESELFVGNVLSQYPRDSFYLATKFPGHMMEYKDGIFSFTGMLANYAHAPIHTPAEIFQKQLEKCQVDYFDFYLLHNVCETAWDLYTNEEAGIIPYLLEQKKAGRIRHLGFSAHCRPETLDKFLDMSEKQFSSCFEFVQLQLNYMDWSLQEAGKKYDIITRHGIPVWVMEPCRGGQLASLNKDAEALLKQRRPEDSIASWAFRYLQSLENVHVVLSGMSTLEQLQDNIATFSKDDPVSPAEKELLNGIIQPLLDLVPCTACRYCCESCPQKLDIPKLIAMYNEAKLNEAHSLMLLGFTLGAMKEKDLPQSCIGCGKCAAQCPQGIEIPGIMKKFSELLKSKK